MQSGKQKKKKKWQKWEERKKEKLLFLGLDLHVGDEESDEFEDKGKDGCAESEKTRGRPSAETEEDSLERVKSRRVRALQQYADINNLRANSWIL